MTPLKTKLNKISSIPDNLITKYSVSAEDLDLFLYSNKTTEKTKKTKTLKGNYQVEIKIKDYGTIYAEIDADTAPITVTNFVNLCKNHFYDGLTFHRIIKDFMIQGGDPNGDGTGGSEETIKGEFTDNGVENPLKHTRGALSMARSQDNDSASSQFFIVQKTASHLDGQYAVFGYVYEGMYIVDKICDDVQVEDNNGTVAKENQPVIESIRCQKIK